METKSRMMSARDRGCVAYVDCPFIFTLQPSWFLVWQLISLLKPGHWCVVKLKILNILFQLVYSSISLAERAGGVEVLVPQLASAGVGGESASSLWVKVGASAPWPAPPPSWQRRGAVPTIAPHPDITDGAVSLPMHSGETPLPLTPPQQEEGRAPYYSWLGWTHMMVPVVVYGCESRTVKKAERRRTHAFEL